VKCDSRLAAYGGVVLQQFEFKKVCVGEKWLSTWAACDSTKIKQSLQFMENVNILTN